MPPGAQFTNRLIAAQQQLGHDGDFDLVDAQPFVEVVAILLHAAVAFDQPHRPQLAEPVERLFHFARLELHQRPAIALLVAGRNDGIEAHRIDVGRGLGLFGQHAGYPAVDGAQRLPAMLRWRGRRRVGRWVGHGVGSLVRQDRNIWPPVCQPLPERLGKLGKAAGIFVLCTEFRPVRH